jgi:hypothetical protein
MFVFGVGVKLAQSSSQLEARASAVPEEMSQTLLTNKKQGNLAQSTRRQHYYF